MRLVRLKMHYNSEELLCKFIAIDNMHLIAIFVRTSNSEKIEGLIEC